MNAKGKIIGLLALAGGTFALSQVLGQRSAKEKNPCVKIVDLNELAIRKRLIVLGLTVMLENPTNHDLKMSLPNFRVFHNSWEVAIEDHSNESIDLKAGESKIISGFTITLSTAKLNQSGTNEFPEESPKPYYEIEIVAGCEAEGKLCTDIINTIVKP